MANTLKSWMILNNATADIPAAGTTGAHDFDTTLLRPFYDTGSVKAPWRANFSLTLVSATGTGIACTSGAAYAAAIADGSYYMDFSRFREARFTCWANISAVTSLTIKVVDTTNSKDVTSALTINSGTKQRWTDAAYTTLDATTIGGSAQFEIQIKQGTAADAVTIYTAQLELR